MTTESDRRIFGFDLVRTIAIMLVVVSHIPHFLPRFPLDALFLNLGFFGVEMFFVLSGVLIGTILIKIFEKGASLRDLWNFWVRRWLRTVPNYMLFLVLNLTLFAWLFGGREFDWRYFFFLQNFLIEQPTQTLMSESWSLTIEEWFYVSFPLVMLASAIVFRSGRYATVFAIAFFIALFTIARVWAATTFHLKWAEELAQVVVYRLDAVAYGVLVAYGLYFHGPALKTHCRRMMLVGVLLLGFCALVSIGVYQGIAGFTEKTFFFNLVGLSFGLMFPWFSHLSCRSSNLAAVITHISIISYSMYLLHLSFVAPLVRPVPLHWSIKVAAYFGLVVALATLVYKYFELPFLKMRRPMDGPLPCPERGEMNGQCPRVY